MRVVPKPANGKMAAEGAASICLSEKFLVKLDLTAVQRANDEYTKTKDEVVLVLASLKEEELARVPEWDLFLSLTQCRTFITRHFVHGIESILTQLPLGFQSGEITPSGVRDQIEDTYRQIDLVRDCTRLY